MVVMVLNAFVFPLIMEQKVSQVDYGTFLKQIEQGKVDSVEIQDNQIGYTVLDGSGREKVYVTGKMDDPDLVNRLYDANVKFTKVVPKEASPFLNKFILAWILPLVIFIAVGQFLMRKMAGKMGGGANAMTFGKSKAKVYVEAQTGKQVKHLRM